jgi:AcrR family transcriptional regulator
MEAALEVFSVSGYNRGSLRAVAERAGLAEATVLHHFPTKEKLLIAVLDNREELVREYLGANPALDARSALLSTIDREDDPHGTYAALFCRLTAEATDPTHPAHGYMLSRYARVRAELTGAFSDMSRDGQLRHNITPSSAANMLMALWDGLLLQSLLDPESVDVRRRLREFVSILTTDAPR